MRALQRAGCSRLILRTHAELDLTDPAAVQGFFMRERPECVINAAGRVGGIMANATYPADFVRNNLAIALNVTHAAWSAGSRRLVYLGSSCIYPRDCPQPMKEEHLLTGPLEPTNQAYAIAKIAGIELCWSYNRQHGARFVALMPTNLYGPGDRYDLEASHVLPALMQKIHNAKLQGTPAVNIWGSGRPRREFLFSDDLAEACVFLLRLPEDRFTPLVDAKRCPLVNVGTGEDMTITELATLVAQVVGYGGTFAYDASKPDGTPRKLLDIGRMTALGWRARVTLREGVRLAYDDFRKRYAAHAA